MQTSAYIFQFLTLFFIIQGLVMMILPIRANKALAPQIRLFRGKFGKLYIGPVKRPFFLRIQVIGFIYFFAAMMVLIHMHFQAGKLAGKDIPVWSSSESQNRTSDVSPTRTSGSSGLHQRISKVVKPFMSRHVGLVVAAIADDETDITGFGRINLHSTLPPDGDAIFEIGSISKVFSALLLADLIAQKKLTLETSALSLLPSHSVKFDARTDNITLQHLVTHTSGLPRMPIQALNPFGIWRAVIAADSYRHLTDEDVLATVARTTLPHDPGSRYDYSNLGFGLLGMILSRQTGMDFDNMVKTFIARPLGMTDTEVHLDQTQLVRLVTGYRSYFHIGPLYVAQLADNWDLPNCMAGAGGLRSTGNDMLLFLAANMGRQKSELSSLLRQSHQVLFSKGRIQIGMGWRQTPLSGSGINMICVDGMTGGYAAFVGFTDNDRAGVVVLSNSSSQVSDVGESILKTIVRRN